MRIENLDTKDTIIFNFDSQDIKGLRGVCNSISMPGDFYSKDFHLVSMCLQSMRMFYLIVQR